MLTQIIFYFILEDFIFYWGHRICTQNGCTNMYTVFTMSMLHRLDLLPNMLILLRYSSLDLLPLLVCCHWATLGNSLVMDGSEILETVEAHCGYHFPWSPSNFFPFYGGADFHDYHHRLLYTKSGNYSSTFTYMDWIFGTDIGYRKLKALKISAVEDNGEQRTLI
ncbi:Fatty acid hydroxylase [Sesbania bispinosa]|nr:Fatty acid hydroxylase [Sesbania bispinosa]